MTALLKAWAFKFTKNPMFRNLENLAFRPLMWLVSEYFRMFMSKHRKA